MILSFATTLAEKAHEDLSFQAISFLTFEAVLEVVIICFAGFMCAKTGLLNLQAQRVISGLNVDFFTPCLVFTKLAPSLSFQKMADIVVIPVFFALSTGISFICSNICSRFLNLNEPESDFVTAMAVFGNSNSLPVSLTLSLAYSLPDLLWEDIEDDSSDKVASRGILYLLIFQQLGQVLRWSWGFNKLLRKRSYEELNNYYKDSDIQANNREEVMGLLAESRSDTTGSVPNYSGASMCECEESIGIDGSNSSDETSNQSSSLRTASIASVENGSPRSAESTVFKSLNTSIFSKLIEVWYKFKNSSAVQSVLKFMNPPLYAMLISVIVASVPFLQDQFFNNEESFIHNTLTKSITQLGSVSIPLILIVLGSNLYPSRDLPPASKHYKRIIIGSLLSRMILPSFVLLPLITLCVKYVKLSILDDPIFLIVGFILTISPPAIQLSQITQINNIYQKEMAGVLFWGYVILTLPTTIFIVVTSLEVLDWAKS